MHDSVCPHCGEPYTDRLHIFTCDGRQGHVEAALNADDFDGETYVRALDHDRLASQLGDVYRVMHDSQWRTLSEISDRTGYSVASISARLRDFRKEKFGGYTVLRRRRGVPGAGLFEYRLIVEQVAAS